MIFTIHRRKMGTWLPWFAWRPVKLTKTRKARKGSDDRVPEPDCWNTEDTQIAWMCWVKRYHIGMRTYYAERDE